MSEDLERISTTYDDLTIYPEYIGAFESSAGKVQHEPTNCAISGALIKPGSVRHPISGTNLFIRIAPSVRNRLTPGMLDAIDEAVVTWWDNHVGSVGVPDEGTTMTDLATGEQVPTPDVSGTTVNPDKEVLQGYISAGHREAYIAEKPPAQAPPIAGSGLETTGESGAPKKRGG